MGTPVESDVRHGHPRVRFGAGRPLVVLPGLTLDGGPPGRLAARSYALGFRGAARERTVHVVSRRRGLARAASLADVAGGYAEFVRREVGPADVVGFSTGGLVAQHLALEHPELVRSLALVVSGSRLSEDGRSLCTRWQELAAAGLWRRLRADLLAVAAQGGPGVGVARVAGWLSGGAPAPVDAADFATLLAADLAHDTTERLGELRTPVLVVGGAVDVFFPEPVLRATAAAVPGAVLRVHPGGHGLPKHRAAAVQADLLAFLRTL